MYVRTRPRAAIRRLVALVQPAEPLRFGVLQQQLNLPIALPAHADVDRAAEVVQRARRVMAARGRGHREAVLGSQRQELLQRRQCFWRQGEAFSLA